MGYLGREIIQTCSPIVPGGYRREGEKGRGESTE
jgi:hypothetical protein